LLRTPVFTERTSLKGCSEYYRVYIPQQEERSHMDGVRIL
jgi:hypothetical protein